MNAYNKFVRGKKSIQKIYDMILSDLIIAYCKTTPLQVKERKVIKQTENKEPSKKLLIMYSHPFTNRHKVEVEEKFIFQMSEKGKTREIIDVNVKEVVATVLRFQKLFPDVKITFKTIDQNETEKIKMAADRNVGFISTTTEEMFGLYQILNPEKFRE